MKLTKDGITKEISKESVIDRMTRQGWVIEGEKPEIIEEIKEAPKRRGRPPKEVNNGND